ncbi:hypothetical protein [Mycolicibacterium brisbanense]|uniref:Uncharacterized protein n=1 Tax=Mycolicibacterium brisbanense TaxID=146020 RepID=A0A117I488_9MYCO|nr:hypothetical protein [Mycolicibacterium brisbanense]MCV7156654.1 hypothetical protein [Mycolicibacterium brisbanense]GAS86552.1 putative uncharacterized protein [Mycolicibacterium brisbanense]
MGNADPVQLGIETAEALQQALAELLSDAMNVQIAAINASPDQFEVLGLRADVPDGSTVRRSRIVIPCRR